VAALGNFMSAPQRLIRGLDSLGSGLDELHHVIGVGDHRQVVRRDLDGGGAMRAANWRSASGGMA